MILVAWSVASASESAWQNLNPSFESGLSGSAHNCNPLTVSNGSVAAYPSCTITCNSGYSQSGSSCVINSNSGGGGGGGGGGTVGVIPTVSSIGSENVTVPLSVDGSQIGSLNQPLSGGAKVELTVPQFAVSTPTAFSATIGSLSSDLTPSNTSGAFMVNNQVFNINAISGGSTVHNFLTNLSITLTVPNLGTSTSSLGVYYFNETASAWVLVPGATFDPATGRVTFQVNHLTRFAVFNIPGLPSVINVASAAGNEVNIEVPGGLSSADYIAAEKSLVKKVNKTLTKRLSGRILLQIEAQGQGWYINPVNGQKYFLGTAADAYQVMRKLGLGVSNKTFATFKNDKAPARLSGRILLKVEDVGKAYYVNPVNLKLYYLGTADDAYGLMRSLGLGITNANLRQITVGELK